VFLWKKKTESRTESRVDHENSEKSSAPLVPECDQAALEEKKRNARFACEANALSLQALSACRGESDEALSQESKVAAIENVANGSSLASRSATERRQAIQ
jgi:hypothetical protein